ncbi:hypothetical protein ACIPEN_10065 [Herbaspirillum chlorophenolicum]|uniref:Transmembrane protein n=1 Tax=Herbaspirillum chlorophenolicum TaxID=211589 RepID=A0ABW8EXH9_9BURK
MRVIFTVIVLFLMTWLFPRMEWVQSHFPAFIYKLLAGLLLGTVASISYATFKYVVREYRKGGIEAIEPEPGWRWFTIIFYCLIFIIGLFIWLTGWEGTNTGAVYGFGIFLGALLVDAGFGPLLEKSEQA